MNGRFLKSLDGMRFIDSDFVHLIEVFPVGAFYSIVATAKFLDGSEKRVLLADAYDELNITDAKEEIQKYVRRMEP